jgi:hypothetical protein
MSQLFILSGILLESKTAICNMVEFPNGRPHHPLASRDRSGPVPTLPKGGITHDQETTCLSGAPPRRSCNPGGCAGGTRAARPRQSFSHPPARSGFGGETGGNPAGRRTGRHRPRHASDQRPACRRQPGGGWNNRQDLREYPLRLSGGRKDFRLDAGQGQLRGQAGVEPRLDGSVRATCGPARPYWAVAARAVRQRPGARAQRHRRRGDRRTHHGGARAIALPPAYGTAQAGGAHLE